MTLVLASASPRRRAILTDLGIEFEVCPSDVDETILGNETPEAAAIRLARSKALAAPEGRWVLSADTIVAINGQILGKPVDADEARSTLQLLRRLTHQVITALSVRTPAGRIFSTFDVAHVTMRSYSDDEIETYIETGDPFDKAGSYAIQHPTFAPVAALDGDRETVIGLPSPLVRQLLTASGFLVGASARS